MEFPVELRHAIEQRAEACTPAQLQKLSQQLTLRYHTLSGRGRSLLRDQDEALAYAIVRMPATFGAVGDALAHTLECTFLRPRSMLDVGAGTGAGSWAAQTLLELDAITCVEREPAMRSLGTALMQQGGKALLHARWLEGDLTRNSLPCHADLVLASYMLNELSPASRTAAVNKLWDSADQLLLILEPGTPTGFSILLQIREQLLGRGAFLAAPCPHTGPCRLSDKDWCHFSARIARSRLHRQLKDADVPYEDEKYAYLAFSKAPVLPASARILRHPKIEKGQITLSMCSADSNQLLPVRKREGERFRRARKVSWGDSFIL